MHKNSNILVVMVLAGMLGAPAVGQIYRWDNGELIPGTEEISPGPGLRISSFDLYAADFSGGLDLSRSSFTQCNLRMARFNNANLTDAFFITSSIDGAEFSGAIINKARLPGHFTADQLYSTASYQAADISGVWLSENALADWDFSGQNITDVRFDWSTGFTAAQLYATASYQSQNIQGVGLLGIDLTGWDFTNQNVIDVSFSDTLTADQLYSTASYQRKNLRGIYFRGDVTGWDFTDQNISWAHNRGGARFTTLTTAELYPTASYKAKDLRGVGFVYTNLSGFDLSNQNLSGSHFLGVRLFNSTNITGAKFSGARFDATDIYVDDLSGMDFSGTVFSWSSLDGQDCENINLHEAWFYGDSGLSGNFKNAILTDTVFLRPAYLAGNVSGADFRGAYFSQDPPVDDDTIRPDGRIVALQLSPGETMIIRDYDGGIAITVDYALRMQTELVRGQLISTSELKLLFEDADWGSTIAFADWISIIELNGTLFLDFAAGADFRSLIGTTFDLFDWDGHLPPDSEFLHVDWPAGFDWDISDLYVGGTVTLVGVPIAGDCDFDSDLDFADLEAALECLAGPDQTVVEPCDCADMDADQDLDIIDVLHMQRSFTGFLP